MKRYIPYNSEERQTQLNSAHNRMHVYMGCIVTMYAFT